MKQLEELEEVLVCAECDEGIIRHFSSGDESFSVCPMCSTVEGNTKYVSATESERYSGEQ